MSRSCFIIFWFLLSFKCVQVKAQIVVSSENRFAEYVNQLLKYPGSVTAMENALSTQLREPIDFNLLRRAILSKMQQEASNLELQELFSWTYLQEKNFDEAFIQESSLDRRLKEDGSRLMELGQYCLSNKSWEQAIRCFRYVTGKGKENKFYELAHKQLLEATMGKIEAGLASHSEIQMLTKEFKVFLTEFPNSANSAEIMYDMAKIEAHYLDQSPDAEILLQHALRLTPNNPNLEAECKLELGDISIMSGKIWDAALYYGQVAKTFGEEPLGQEARFRSARIYYFTGDFALAKSQLDVLKTATTELVSNDALKLALIIQENTTTDSVAPALKMFSHSELLLYRNKEKDALKVMDSIRTRFPGNSLEPEILLAEARIQLHTGTISQAKAKLELILEKYPHSVRADDALYLLATINEQRLNDKTKALALYNDLLLHYPASFYVPDSRKKIRFLRGEKVEM